MKKKKKWRYLTRPNLELDILIFLHGCCKKMVYQYVVVAKMKKTTIIDL
jgi:hypothetical protein